MSTTVTVHSYRGGTGKSSIAGALALLAAADGKVTALVDADLQTPSAHVLFGIDEPAEHRSLADYLIGRCEIEDAAEPVSMGERGALFVVPAHCAPEEIDEIMTRGYDVGLLREGFGRLIDRLSLDVLILDTRAGVSNETISAIAGSDVVLTVTRADHLDARAKKAVAVTCRFTRARHTVAVNMLPDGLPAEPVRRRAQEVFGSAIAAVIPYYADIAAFGSRGLFIREHPNHQAIPEFRRIAAAVLDGKEQ